MRLRRSGPQHCAPVVAAREALFRDNHLPITRDAGGTLCGVGGAFNHGGHERRGGFCHDLGRGCVHRLSWVRFVPRFVGGSQGWSRLARKHSLAVRAGLLRHRRGFYGSRLDLLCFESISG